MAIYIISVYLYNQPKHDLLLHLLFDVCYPYIYQDPVSIAPTEVNRLEMKMNVRLVLTIIALVAGDRQDKPRRMSLYFRHHGFQRKISVVQNRRIDTIRQKLCNPMSCRKCLNVFAYGRPKQNGKITTACAALITLPNCCVRKMILREGF